MIQFYFDFIVQNTLGTHVYLIANSMLAKRYWLNRPVERQRAERERVSTIWQEMLQKKQSLKEEPADAKPKKGAKTEAVTALGKNKNSRSNTQVQ